MFQPAPSASDSGSRKVIHPRLLIVVQHKPPGQRHRRRDRRRRSGAIHHQDSPARNSSEQPSATMISVVPRLGCSTTKTAGMPIIAKRDGQAAAAWRRPRCSCRAGSAPAPASARSSSVRRAAGRAARCEIQRCAPRPTWPDHIHRDQQQQRQRHRRDRPGSSRRGCRSPRPRPERSSPTAKWTDLRAAPRAGNCAPATE